MTDRLCWVRLFCGKCGDEIKEPIKRTEEGKFTIQPCPNCLANTMRDGYDAGYDEGYNTAKDESR